MKDKIQNRHEPQWSRLYETAVAQDGHFTTAQAADAGYSPQLLAKYLKNGRIVRSRRGVYRLVHFPSGDHEDLVVIWLWSERTGVFSHETALALHHLSDALPARINLTVPSDWKARRLRVPPGTVLHFADLSDNDRAWVGSVVVTSPARTVVDCADAYVSPEIVGQAIEEGVHRGIFTESMIKPAVEYLQSFEEGSQ